MSYIDDSVSNLEIFDKIRALTTDECDEIFREITIKAIRKYRSLSNDVNIDIVLTKIDHLGIDIKDDEMISSEMIYYPELFPFIKKQYLINKIKNFIE